MKLKDVKDMLSRDVTIESPEFGLVELNPEEVALVSGGTVAECTSPNGYTSESELEGFSADLS